MLELVSSGAAKAPINKGVIKKVVTGQQDVAVLTTTGNVYSIGTANFTGTGSASGSWVKLTDNVSQIVSAYRAIFLMKNDGTFWFIGLNNQFPAGLGTTITTLTDVTSYFSSLLAGKTVKKISMSHLSLGVLCTDGTLILSGSNTNGGMGVGNTTAQRVPFKLSNISDVIDVQFDNYTYDNTYLLRAGGLLYGAGNSDYGQLGNLSTNITTFRQTTTTANITKIVAGSQGVFAFYRNPNNGIGNIGMMGRQFSGSFGTGAGSNTNYTTMTSVVTIASSSSDPEIYTGAYHGRYWVLNTSPYYTGTSGAFVGGDSVFNNTTRYSFTAMPTSTLAWESYDASKTNYNNSYVVSSGNLYGAGASGTLLPGTSGNQPTYVLLKTDTLV